MFVSSVCHATVVLVHELPGVRTVSLLKSARYCFREEEKKRLLSRIAWLKLHDQRDC